MKTQKKEELKYKLENIIEYKTDKISKDKVKVKISYLIRNRMENLNTRLHECGSNINHIKIIEGIEFRDRETDKITRNKYDLIFMNDYKHSFTSSAGFKDTITGDCFTMDMFMNIEDL